MRTNPIRGDDSSALLAEKMRMDKRAGSRIDLGTPGHWQPPRPIIFGGLSDFEWLPSSGLSRLFDRACRRSICRQFYRDRTPQGTERGFIRGDGAARSLTARAEGEVGTEDQFLPGDRFQLDASGRS